MDVLRRFGGTAGVLMILSGAGVIYFAPDYRPYGWISAGVGLFVALLAAFMNSADLLGVVRGRPFRYGTNAVFYSLFVLLVVAALNLLASRHNRRFDLTGQDLNSVSPQTVQILEGLDQDVTVAAFYSSQFTGSRRKAIDLLEEYEYHSPRISVRVIDPVRSPGEVRAYGVETDGTIIFSTRDGEARTTTATEEELTNALLKATAENKKVICMTTGHGEKGIEDAGPQGFQLAAEALRRENFEVRELRLLEGPGVPSECSSVIVSGPTHAMLEPEAASIEEFLSGGGRALVLGEPRTATGLERVLKLYGLELGDDFIVDVNPINRLFGGSPSAPVVYEYGSHSITKDFEGLATIFPTVGSVRTTTPESADVTTSVLAHTGEHSWGEMGELADEVSFDPDADSQGPLDIAALAVRRSDSPGPSATDPNVPKEGTATGSDRVTAETRLAVFGDSDYAGNSAFLLAGNKDLFLNVVAWLNERSDLISIRPKTRVPQPVILTGVEARLLYLWWLTGPVLAIVLGVGVHLNRRRL